MRQKAIYTVLGIVCIFCAMAAACGGGGYLWFLDASAGGMFKFDKTTGAELDFFSLNQWGSGITWDGNYLWMSRAPA